MDWRTRFVVGHAAASQAVLNPLNEGDGQRRRLGDIRCQFRCNSIRSDRCRCGRHVGRLATTRDNSILVIEQLIILSQCAWSLACGCSRLLGNDLSWPRFRRLHIDLCQLLALSRPRWARRLDFLPWRTAFRHRSSNRYSLPYGRWRHQCRRAR